MDTPFDFIWPAVTRRRYWQVVAAVALKGAAMGAAVGTAITSLLGGFSRLYSSPGPPDRLALWWNEFSGSGFLVLILVLALAGTLLYSANRIWRAEREDGPAGTLDAMREFEIVFAKSRTLDGAELFREWGDLLRDNKQTTYSWVTTVVKEVNASQFVRAADGHPPGAHVAVDWSTGTENLLLEFLEDLELRGLVEFGPPQEYFFPRVRCCTLTLAGRELLIAARTLVQSSGIAPVRKKMF